VESADLLAEARIRINAEEINAETAIRIAASVTAHRASCTVCFLRRFLVVFFRFPGAEPVFFVDFFTTRIQY
jgi:hypothetical protein